MLFPVPFCVIVGNVRDELGKQRYLTYCDQHGVDPQPWEELNSTFKEQWYPAEEAQRKPVQVEMQAQHPARKTG